VAQAAGAVTVSARGIRAYARKTLGLKRYFAQPGDGRVYPVVSASTLLWAQVLGYLLREPAYHAMEGLARCGKARALGLGRRFGDDALGYFTERLDADQTRLALAGMLRRAKRSKVFDGTRYIGLALDGTGAGRSKVECCELCRPIYNAAHEVVGYNHGVCAIMVVGCEISLPFDVEPYGPGGCEYNAGKRLLTRAVGHLGRRFADYVVVDGEFATAPFLHTAGEAGLYVVARLKDNLPELYAQAKTRFAHMPPTTAFMDGTDYVEVWDADDFDPWETLQWQSVRVMRYRQHKPDGREIEAYWLTDFPARKTSSRTLYTCAKARWEIENQGFNEGKNHHGFEHIPHHHANSLLIHWLLICLTLCIERLFRLRYLHRGTHRPPSSIHLLRRLRLSLTAPPFCDTS
jgi:hypothetical protein